MPGEVMRDGGTLAIIAGSGALPRLLADAEAEAGRSYRIVVFAGTTLDWTAGRPVIPAEYEKPGRLFRTLRKAGVSQVTFAGGMSRPHLRPLNFDLKGLMLAPSIFKAMKAGDDATLRAIRQAFEAERLEVIAPHALLSALLMPEGVLGALQPSEDDRADTDRAVEIVRALGRADVGQGAVVAQGVCLGLESIQGTDAMLQFVADTGARFRHDPEGARGVLLKAPKPGQDWSIDLPAIGPKTLQMAARAGLAGVVAQSGAVLVLGLSETVSEADRLGLFLWGRPSHEPET